MLFITILTNRPLYVVTQLKNFDAAPNITVIKERLRRIFRKRSLNVYKQYFED